MQVCYSKCTLTLLLLCAVSGSRPCMSTAMEPWRDTEGCFRDERWGPLGCPCSSGPPCGQPGRCPLPAGHSGHASAGRTSDRAGFRYEPVRADLSQAGPCQQIGRVTQDEAQAVLDQHCSQSMLAVVDQQACAWAGPRVNTEVAYAITFAEGGHPSHCCCACGGSGSWTCCGCTAP